MSNPQAIRTDPLLGACAHCFQVSKYLGSPFQACSRCKAVPWFLPPQNVEIRQVGEHKWEMDMRIYPNENPSLPTAEGPFG